MSFRCYLTVSLVAMIACACGPAYAALSADDFNNYPPGALPDGWGVYQGNWEILFDSLYYNDAESGWGAVRYNAGEGWTDYVLTVQSNLEYMLESTYANFAIGGRVNSNGGGYWLIRGFELGGYLAMIRTDNYARWPSQFLGSAYLAADGQPHVFSLVFDNSTISVFADGKTKPLIQATDSTYSSGSIAFESGAGCFAWFDNVTVENAVVPEPSGLLALASGLLIAVGARRRRT